MTAAKTIRAAASVILLNSKRRSVLLMKRSPTASFMPNALVFPGGVVESADTVSAADTESSTRVAALRELFEETGILLAKDGFKAAASDPKLAKSQDLCKDKPEIFSSLSPDPSPLLPWSQWVTPFDYKQRFQTRFFVLFAEEELPVHICEREMADYRWWSVGDALREARAGRVIAPPPQYYELSRINYVPDWTKLAAKRAERANEPPICPQQFVYGDRYLNLLPGDTHYVGTTPEVSWQQPRKDGPPPRIEIGQPCHRLSFLMNPLYANVQIEIRGAKDYIDFKAENSKL